MLGFSSGDAGGEITELSNLLLFFSFFRIAEEGGRKERRENGEKNLFSGLSEIIKQGRTLKEVG